MYTLVYENMAEDIYNGNDIQTSKVNEYCYASNVMWFVDIFFMIVKCVWYNR